MQIHRICLLNTFYIYLQKKKIMAATKTKNLTIRVTEGFAETLKSYAKERYMSQANLIEYLVRKEIDKPNSFITKPTENTRKDWESAFKEMHENGDDKLLIDDVFNDENFDEWK